MAKLIGVLISHRRQGLIARGLGLILLLILVSVASILAVNEVTRLILAESREAMQPYEQITADLESTFDALETQITAAACTPEFFNQMRRVAFRPDIFSELLYAPGGVVQCSASASEMPAPVPLGTPDIVGKDASVSSIWFDRGLGFAGLNGLHGSIVLRGDYAVVVPKRSYPTAMPTWIDYEVVLTDGRDVHWPRAGSVGVFERYEISKGPNASTVPTTLRTNLCNASRSTCVATQLRLGDFLRVSGPYILATLLALGLFSARIAEFGRSAMVRYWSFDSRFRRRLDADSVMCVYQPIMAVGTGEIVGCEILVRWRDVDDSVVYPDRFIPLVERLGLTEKLTRLVVECACRELREQAPADRRLKLTFNIYPRDLDADLLLDIFKPFDELRDRFDLVVEIIESDEIDIASAQRQIEALRRAGIRTYIDDFGSGYSNIQNLAALAVDGVKLDRAFAMAPAGSLMAQMLGHAIGMIHASGRAIVIEGVETAKRLQELRELVPPIDFAQGYHIARPLDIERFCEFLASRSCERTQVELAA